MGFLRRILRGDPSTEGDPAPAFDPAAAEADERTRDLELLRDDNERLDELAQRQLRYAAYAWQPPAQGGLRRADDGDPGKAGSGEVR